MKHQSQIQILNHATAYEDEDFDKSYDSRSDSVTGWLLKDGREESVKDLFLRYLIVSCRDFGRKLSVYIEHWLND